MPNNMIRFSYEINITHMTSVTMVFPILKKIDREVFLLYFLFFVIIMALELIA